MWQTLCRRNTSGLGIFKQVRQGNLQRFGTSAPSLGVLEPEDTDPPLLSDLVE
jgi:hypothetical protein